MREYRCPIIGYRVLLWGSGPSSCSYSRTSWNTPYEYFLDGTSANRLSAKFAKNVPRSSSFERCEEGTSVATLGANAPLESA
jgi:hypothetical protein